MVTLSSYGILSFRTKNYATVIFLSGTNRLTARDGFVGVASGYYPYIEEYAANNYSLPVITNALTKGWINQKEYSETVALIPLPTPSAPIVSADNENNLIQGIDATMEYLVDSNPTYVSYNPTVPIDLSGDHSVKVRVSAIDNVKHASPDTILVFEKNPPLPVKPPLPLVVSDDDKNVIVGIDSSMEYSIDGAPYLPYTMSQSLELSGERVVKVRVMSEGINPPSDEVVLTFTTNPVTPVAPEISVDDTNNRVIGMEEGYEYSIDGSVYQMYNSIIFSMINFSGKHFLSVRVAANGINPCGNSTTLTFTDNI